MRGERNSFITMSACDLIGPDPGQAGELAVDAEELGDPAGGRRVEHHRVVLPGVASAAAVLGGLEDLAGEQHVADAGRERGRELDDAEAVERRPARPSR